MKYVIRKGTKVSIAKDDEIREYRAHTMRKTLEFTSYRTKDSGAYTFLYQGWIILLRGSKVETRKE